MAEAETRLDEQIETLERGDAPAAAAQGRRRRESAILEIRAGTGGDEAALFAGDLFRMYQRYADLQGWKVESCSESEGEAGGYKEVIANDHRQGRVRPAEIRKRRAPRAARAGDRGAAGASTPRRRRSRYCPRPRKSTSTIRPEDIRIDTMRASGAGGQHVNTTDFGRPHHPHPDRHHRHLGPKSSQHQNRAQAMEVLRARLYDLEREKRDSERAGGAQGQVGSGDRSERIRTYNFPQGRVTDHRINLTLYKLDQVLAGEALDELIEALITDHQATLLAEGV